MRKAILATFVGVFALFLGAQPALADSPHFLYANSSISSSTGALSVSFKEAGLGNTATTENITLTAHVDATYQCFNNGGNHPKAGNKETVSQVLQVPGTFPVRNGSTTGTLSASSTPGTFTCPNGQTLYLVDVMYSNIFVTGSAQDTLQASPDPIGLTGVMILV